MAIDPADLKKIDGLNINPDIDFEQYIPQAKGGAIPEALKLETLLRTRATEAIDATGVSAILTLFDTYNSATVTIDQDCEIELRSETNEIIYVKVIKGINDIVTFKFQTAIDSKQIGETVLNYQVIVIGGQRVINRIDNQFEDSLVIGNLTPATGIITSFNYFNSTTNNNVCTFEASFTYTPAASISNVVIALSGWDVTKYNSGVTSCTIGATEVVTPVPCVASIDATNLYITYFTAITGASIISINGSFRIK